MIDYLKFQFEKVKREKAEEIQELKYELNRTKNDNQYSKQKEEYEAR